MKKYFAFILLFHLLFLSGCNKSMNYIIQNEPSVVGIVEKVYENSILIYCEQMDGYLTPVRCSVSLNVENKDSVTHFNIGDEVVVYYDGQAAETDPLQINTVYAITLRTPAERVDLEEGKIENSVKEWTTQEIAELFKAKADEDCILIACASMYNYAYDRVGTILYTDGKEGYIHVAFMDKEGNMQHCGVGAQLVESPEFTYWGNGEVTFKVCSKDGTNYTQKISFSVDEEGVNFVSEAIEDISV